MNFLAHAYLSFGQAEILVGNMMTDFIRGYKKEDFSENIRTGIALHYAIDTFTDRHPATLNAKEYLRPAGGKYCGVFMDVVYDHFLANDINCFSLQELDDFSQKTYQTLSKYSPILPERFKHVFDYMKKDNWLFHYHTKEGIRKSFKGIYRRAAYLEESDAAYLAFNTHYDRFQKAYSDFMPDMIRYAQNFLHGKGT